MFKMMSFLLLEQVHRLLNTASNTLSALFGVITQRKVLISYRRFGITSVPKRHHHHTLCNNPEERRSHSLRGGSLKSRTATNTFYKVWRVMSLQAATIFDGRQCYAGGYGTKTTSHDPTEKKNLGAWGPGILVATRLVPCAQSIRPVSHPLTPKRNEAVPHAAESKTHGAPCCWK